MEISIAWNICRVCLVEEQKKPPAIEPMCHLFNEGKHLAKQIYECTGIMMKKNDNLPEKICKKCLTMFKYAIKFRKTCRASDTYLHTLIQRTRSAKLLFDPDKLPSDDEHDNEDQSKADSNCPEINSNTDDIITQAEEEQDKEGDIVEMEEVDEHSESVENQLFDVETHDSRVSEEKESVVGHSDEQEYLTNEVTNEDHDDDFNEESQEMDIKNIDLQEAEIQQNLQDELHLETIDQEDDNVEFIPVEQEDVGEESYLETDDDHAQVSSTVVSKHDFMEQNSNSSMHDNDSGTEYIVDEYLIDDTNNTTSLKISSVVVVNSPPTPKSFGFYPKRKRKTVENKQAPLQQQTWDCEICGNIFATRHILNAHIRVHRQEKNHECELCFKRFITACNLQAHMRIHTGEKPFACQYCGRRFSDRSSNLRHERIHTNEKPFKCNDCGKSFSLSTTLKKHLKIHTGERSYRCEICEKSFKLPHQLKAHKNTNVHKAVEHLGILEN